MRSIRRFQLLALVGGAIVITTGIGLFEYRVMRHAVFDNLDQSVFAKAAAIASLTTIDTDRVELELTPETMPEFMADSSPEYFQVWIGEQVLDRAESLFGADLPRRMGTPDEPLAFNLDLPDGRRGRAVGVSFPIGEEDDDDDDDDDEDDDDEKVILLDLGAMGDRAMPRAEIVVAVSREPAEQSLQTLLLGMIIVSFVFAGLLTGLIWVTISVGLGPLRSIAREIRAIDERQLQHRVGSSKAPVELGPIIQSVNNMLERLEVAWAKEQRVTASIAHELRTPIAEMQAALEVSQRWPSDEALSNEAMDTVRESITRLTRLADAVLAIHKATASNDDTIELERVSLEPVVDRVASHFKRRAAERDIALDRITNGQALVRTSEPILELILNNLIDNAIEHSWNGDPVRIEIRGDEQQVHLSIVNTFDPSNPPDLMKLSEPYWRGDASRTNPRHVGLGLTVVESVAPIGALRISFGLTGPCFRATIRAHRARAARPAGASGVPGHVNGNGRDQD